MPSTTTMAPERIAEGLLSCEVAGVELTYDTALDSCDEADEEGRRLAKRISSPSGTDEIHGIEFGSLRSTIQGNQPMTYSTAESAELAEALNEEVCPGNLDNLSPSELLTTGTWAAEAELGG